MLEAFIDLVVEYFISTVPRDLPIWKNEILTAITNFTRSVISKLVATATKEEVKRKGLLSMHKNCMLSVFVWNWETT